MQNILYQYVTSEVGIKIIDHNSAGFRPPKYFNDPFEACLAPIRPAIDAQKLELDMANAQGTPISQGIKDAFKLSEQILNCEQISLWCATLCLTKEPLNPLMWAHYAGVHGMTFGYDVTSEFFRGFHNICPIQYGRVRYMPRRKSPLRLTTNCMPDEDWYAKEFNPDNYEIVKDALLTKPQYWKYEKEVRIVKRTNEDTEAGIRTIITDNNKELYLYKLPENSIKEIYCHFDPLRLHAFKKNKTVGAGKEVADSIEYIKHKTNAEIYAVLPGKTSWTFESFLIA